MAGQPYAAAVTNLLQNRHATLVTRLPEGLRYDPALRKIVGTPIQRWTGWVTLALVDGRIWLSSRAVWFVVG